MKGALETSNLKPADVGHVHAHGLSSDQCDRDEATAINAVMGDRPVTAAKSYMGNLGGGCGIVEVISSIMAMDHGSLFPIINCDSLDPACPIAAVREKGVDAGNSFLNLNITPQGQASSILIKKFD